MADLNRRIHLCVMPLTTAWQPFLAHIRCRSIELTADKQWMWCTSTENPDAVRTIDAFQREMVVDFGQAVSVAQNEPVFYFKGVEQGKIWDKCVR